MPSDVKDPEKSTEKDDQKKKKTNGTSFLRSLTDSLTDKRIQKQETEDNPTVSKPGTGKFTERTSNSPKKVKKKEKDGKEDKELPPEKDPSLYIIYNFKDHEKVQSLRKKKNSILKVIAITISIILIIIAVVYSLSPTEQVASNVIFGERAMFSVLLILVALLILSAVFAGKLLEGKLLKNIRQDLEIVEGKKQKDDQIKSNHDPMESMNKKN